MNLTIKLCLFFSGTFISTIVFIKVLIGFAKTLGIRGNNNTELRWNSQAKPSLGGIAIFLSVFTSIFTYLVSHPAENIFGNATFVLFFIGMCLSFFMGLTDDAFDTRPLIKFLVQILCGVLIVSSNNIIPISPYFALNAFVTVLWTVGLMNSLNMLDNMDGITASVATSIFLIFILTSLFFCCNILDIYIFILIGFIGATLGFLVFNRPPSKLFMGDSGSQLIGFTIAFFSVHVVWDFKGTIDLPFWAKTVILLMILSIPFIDTFTVVFNRIRRGVSPARGGKDHTTHYLFYSGFSEKKVWLFYTCTSLLLGFTGYGILFLFLQGFNYWVIFLLLPLFFLFTYLFRLTHVQKSPTSAHKSPPT